MATLPLGTYTHAIQNIPTSPGVPLGRFFGVGSLAPLQPALYCSTVQPQPRRAALGSRRAVRVAELLIICPAPLNMWRNC